MSNRLGGFIAGQNTFVSIGTFTAVTSPTFTFASASATPAVGQAVQFTTTGTLPTGLSQNTKYYVISVSTNTCQFSTTVGGSAVTFTNSSGSGTHTAVIQRAFNAYGGVTDTIEYLVVAGGGSGGGNPGNTPAGGGGGAGGLLTGANYAVAPSTAYIVTIGAGAVAKTGGNYSGNNGSDSVFGTQLTAIGGGGGGSFGVAAASGGSGGGGTWALALAGSGTAGQGNSGGSNSNNSGNFQGGAGGGGAGSVGGSLNQNYGSPYVTNNGGTGGAGLVLNITGQPVVYASGGGGGGGSGQAPYGQGGPATANGGFGGSAVYGQGTQNRFGANLLQGGSGAFGSGSGGGGGGCQASPYQISYGGNGGSGTVVVRYPQNNAPPAIVTGSPQVYYADGYQIYVWTSSGSIIF